MDQRYRNFLYYDYYEIHHKMETKIQIIVLNKSFMQKTFLLFQQRQKYSLLPISSMSNVSTT